MLPFIYIARVPAYTRELRPGAPGEISLLILLGYRRTLPTPTASSSVLRCHRHGQVTRNYRREKWTPQSSRTVYTGYPGAINAAASPSRPLNLLRP